MTNHRLSDKDVLIIRIEQFIEQQDLRNGLLINFDAQNQLQKRMTVFRTAIMTVQAAGFVPIELNTQAEPAKRMFRILDMNPRGFFIVDMRDGYVYDDTMSILMQATKPVEKKMVTFEGKTFEFRGKFLIISETELDPSFYAQLVVQPALEHA